MKKFAYMLAALSLCAVSFVACDDDKDNNENNGNNDPKVECSSNDDCKDNAEGKIVCEANKCVAPAAEADKDDCNSDDDCINNSNGKVECNSSKKCDFPSDPSDEDACDASSYVPQCENGDAWVCKESKRVKEACGEGKECKEGQGCVEKVDKGECYDDPNVCKTKGDDYFCNDSYQCEQKSAEPQDPCKDVSCDDGFSCLEGICVSEAMKALADGADYPANSPESFCNSGKLIYNNKGKASVIDCVGNGYSGCAVYVDPSDPNNTRIADCNAQQSAIDACVAANKAKMDVCITSTELYQIFCMEDIVGNAIAVPTYSGDNDGKCEEGKSCVMEGESASCK